MGNPGSGKSTILNGIADKVIFKSGISIGTGLTTVLQKYEHEGVSLYDTPGLADIKFKKQAGTELDKLLEKKIPLKIAFVVTLERGRVRPEDALTINLVLEAIRNVDTNDRFGVIINQVTEGVRKQLDESPEKEAILRKNLLGERSTPYWCRVLLDHSLSDEMDGLLMTPELKYFLVSLPETKPRHAHTEPIDTDEMEEKLEQQVKLLNDIKEANREERSKMVEELERQKNMYSAQEAKYRDLEDSLRRKVQKIEEENAAARAAAAAAEAGRAAPHPGRYAGTHHFPQQHSHQMTRAPAHSQQGHARGRTGMMTAAAIIPAVVAPSMSEMFKLADGSRKDNSSAGSSATVEQQGTVAQDGTAERDTLSSMQGENTETPVDGFDPNIALDAVDINDYSNISF